MGWAFLWSLMIYGAAAGTNPMATNSDAGGAAFLAFLVIWYFADKARKAEAALRNMPGV